MDERELQRSILEELNVRYPGFVKKVEIGNFDDVSFERALAYLCEYGLARVHVNRHGEKDYERYYITAHGIDFLMDDGGLGAILGVTTIKIHPDTIKALVSESIMNSNIPDKQKSEFQDTLKKAPTTALNALITKSVEFAVTRAPSVLDAVLKSFV